MEAENQKFRQGSSINPNILYTLILVPLLVVAEGEIFEQGVRPLSITCTPPTDRTDGTELSLSELSHNHIYLMSRFSEDQYIIDEATIYCEKDIDINELPVGQYDVAATAVDTNELESSYSEYKPIELVPYMSLEIPNAPTNGVIY